MEQSKPVVILSAGGNATGVIFFNDKSHRSKYASIAQYWMKKNKLIEQFGFLEENQHLQMSGGEFCGNAARVAALLIAEATGKKKGTFTISGFSGNVRYRILARRVVECDFPKFKVGVECVYVCGVAATLVDMGGIVHVVLPLTTPFDPNKLSYQRKHREITEALGLQNRLAVGVIWQEKKSGGGIKIHPVVWVKGINSFFYETACGSGTLATLLAGHTDTMRIFQPSGQVIEAQKRKNNILMLRSKMAYANC